MIRHIRAVGANSAGGTVAQIYGQIRREFGVLGEPLTLHAPLPPLLAAVWCSFRESILVGSVSREVKEAVAVAISRANECSYCVDAHTIMLRALNSHSAATSIRRGREEHPLGAIVDWAVATRFSLSPELRPRPFSPSQAPEIIGAAVWVHYINRMVSLFLNRKLLLLADDPLGLRTLAERMGGIFFSRVVRRPLLPGSAAALIGDAPLPDDLAWAAPSDHISRAYAALAQATGDAGRSALAQPVRDCVSGALKRWDGSDPGISRGWAEQTASSVDIGMKPQAKLALLVAMTPHQVDDGIVGDFRTREPADEKLLGAAAWASFAAARRIGSWL